MISAEQNSQALRALQRLIVHAKAQAYEAGQIQLADILNDMELLPEFLAHDSDRTSDFLEMLQSIAEQHPDCRYILEEYRQLAPSSS